MTPNLGRGGCEALLDAVTLGRLLGELPLDEALVAYERARVRSSQRLRAASGALMRVALAERVTAEARRMLGLVGHRRVGSGCSGTRHRRSRSPR